MPTKIDPQKTLEEILHSEENDKHAQRDTEKKINNARMGDPKRSERTLQNDRN